VEKRNLALINAYHMTSFAQKPLVGGLSALQRVEAFAKSLPNVSEIRYITSINSDFAVGTPANEEIATSQVELEASTPEGLLGLFPTEDFADVFYMYADCPFLDEGITATVYSRHAKYLSQYSFSDGYPYGIVPEVIATEIVPKLRSLAHECVGPVTRETLFKVIQEDINAFDIETDLSPKDQRMLRVSLSADTHRNTTILERIIAAGGTDAETITSILDEKPELLRSVPAYISIQITDGCPQKCSYCPYPLIGGDILNQNNAMSVERFSHIVSEVKDFCDDGVINISAWGEPSLHPDIEAIAQEVLSRPELTLLIETSGIGWKPGVIEALCESWGARITWIVSLDAIDPTLYQSLRGNGFTEAMQSIELLLDRATDNTFVQAVRMKESEEALEGFYRFWKEKAEHVIIQKYSTYSGKLSERKVTDLSPLKRFPCWHLKRDMVVLLDGSVPVCREDVDRKHILGNIFDESIEIIWERGADWYEKHIREDYPEVCRSCDEYYTFNY